MSSNRRASVSSGSTSASSQSFSHSGWRCRAFVVDDHLDVEGHQVTLGGHGDRINLDQAGVVFHKRLVDCDHDRPGGVRLQPGQAQVGGQFSAAGVFESGFRVDRQFENFVGGSGGGLLDVGTALGRSQKGDPAEGPVDQRRQINLLGDVAGFFHIDPAHLLAFGAGLRRHQPGAQHLGRRLGDVLGSRRHLDTTGPAAAAGVDLRLDHEGVTAEFFGRSGGLVGGRGDRPRRHGDAVLLEQFLGLVFMQVHQPYPPGPRNSPIQIVHRLCGGRHPCFWPVLWLASL